MISGPAYSHEVCSAGFWPGGGAIDRPAYYCYMVPAPAGIAAAPIRPPAARWSPELSKFILMYDDVRSAAEPEQALYDFLESSYEAAARLAGWDRPALDLGCGEGHRGM